MKIGVSGASGQLGKAVVDMLLQQGGHEIVAVSRTPDQVEGALARRHGDYDEPTTLAPAYAGLDRLLIIPTADVRPGVRSAQLRAAIDAAVAAKVGHVVLMSSCGNREAAETTVVGTYWAAEQYLMAANLPAWTILRMNYYTEAMADEAVSSLPLGMVTGLGDEKVAYISRDDVAAMAASILTGEGHAGATYDATGPVAVTGPERAAMVSRIIGRDIPYVPISEEQLRGGLAQAQLPDFLIDVIVELKTGHVDGTFDIATDDMTRLTGRGPKSVEEVLKSRLPAQG